MFFFRRNLNYRLIIFDYAPHCSFLLNWHTVAYNIWNNFINYILQYVKDLLHFAFTFFTTKISSFRHWFDLRRRRRNHKNWNPIIKTNTDARRCDVSSSQKLFHRIVLRCPDAKFIHPILYIFESRELIYIRPLIIYY